MNVYNARYKIIINYGIRKILFITQGYWRIFFQNNLYLILYNKKIIINLFIRYFYQIKMINYFFDNFI